MLSEELSDSGKLDQLHALIPLDAFKITRSVAMKVMAINSWIGWPKKVSIYSG